MTIEINLKVYRQNGSLWYNLGNFTDTGNSENFNGYLWHHCRSSVVVSSYPSVSGFELERAKIRFELVSPHAWPASCYAAAIGNIYDDNAGRVCDARKAATRVSDKIIELNCYDPSEVAFRVFTQYSGSPSVFTFGFVPPVVQNTNYATKWKARFKGPGSAGYLETAWYDIAAGTIASCGRDDVLGITSAWGVDIVFDGKPSPGQYNFCRPFSPYVIDGAGSNGFHTRDMYLTASSEIRYPFDFSTVGYQGDWDIFNGQCVGFCCALVSCPSQGGSYAPETLGGDTTPTPADIPSGFEKFDYTGITAERIEEEVAVTVNIDVSGIVSAIQGLVSPIQSIPGGGDGGPGGNGGNGGVSEVDFSPLITALEAVGGKLEDLHKDLSVSGEGRIIDKVNEIHKDLSVSGESRIIDHVENLWKGMSVEENSQWIPLLKKIHDDLNAEGGVHETRIADLILKILTGMRNDYNA